MPSLRTPMRTSGPSFLSFPGSGLKKKFGVRDSGGMLVGAFGHRRSGFGGKVALEFCAEIQKNSSFEEFVPLQTKKKKKKLS